MTHLTLITGSSRGMGAAMALQRLAQGHTVVGIARRANPELDSAAARHGATLLQWQHDLAEPAAAADQVLSWLASQPLGAFASATLINNAGVVGTIQPLYRVEAADLSRSLRVGLEAAMVVCAAFLRGTSGWPGPRKVLNISSGLGRRPQASSAAYCAAKAGMDMFSRAVALEEQALPNGARIVSLAPGVIATDMQAELRNADPAAFPDHERFVQLHAQGQLTSPEDAARRVLAWLDRPDFGNQPVADVRDA